ncbi:LOW QUALITY PROTEIN: hypothetical protein Fmac_008939 [Flemingia macrophylla]|uniref:Uncharacterized protein n=1 Tax=Flemingia macrophylla TaxID=520843 RepID=A0ABD1MYT6_9FABA
MVCRGDQLQGPEVKSFIIAALCESFRFDCDLELFGSSGLVPLDNACEAWIKDLVQGSKVDETLDRDFASQGTK